MPSLAILSRLGVRPAIKPRLYAPMFHIPMSSPMMTRILGLSAAWAQTARSAAISGAVHCVSIFSFIVFCLIVYVDAATSRPLLTDHRCFHCFLFFFLQALTAYRLRPCQ